MRAGHAATAVKIGQLTDVSLCNLQQYLSCNRNYPAWQGTQMKTMVPLRPTVQRPRRVLLHAGPAAAAVARSQVRRAIFAWDIPVDTETAVLLTSELVTNAIAHEAGKTVMLTITCICGQLRVDVHDTSPAPPVAVTAPADAETGRGLMLVASLSTDWGFHWTPTGKAVYFTLGCQDGP
jgi:anti-sigma regulatory factor (Ser/Thr protein kinase)